MKNILSLIIFSIFGCVELFGADIDLREWLHRLVSMEFSEPEALVALSKLDIPQDLLTAVNKEGRTPFHVAVNAGKLQLARKLVDNKKLVFKECDDNDLSPLHSAVATHSEMQIEFLINLGADPSATKCNNNKLLRLLLIDEPNFAIPAKRKEEDGNVNYWLIVKAIIETLGMKLSVEDVRHELNRAQGRVMRIDKARSRLIKDNIVDPLKDILMAHEDPACDDKVDGQNPAFKRITRSSPLESGKQARTNNKRPPSSDTENESSPKKPKLDTKSEDKNVSPQRAKNNGSCPVCDKPYYATAKMTAENIGCLRCITNQDSVKK